jgi:hypothetical protein
MLAMSPPLKLTCAPASGAHRIAFTVSRGRYWYAATRSSSPKIARRSFCGFVAPASLRWMLCHARSYRPLFWSGQ